MDGIINIYKEKDFTSFDVVAKLRGICRQKKIGHTGTLDPQAEGVLPVCLGKATRVCDLLTDKDKEYEAVLRLGIVTDTQDIFGEIREEKEVKVTEDEVREVIGRYVGKISQIPPMYSALKVDGKKLCDLARAGKEVERKPREVFIREIRILDMNLPRIRIHVCCSKGTYIRTLCHDIGQELGCGGCMESLIRTRVDRFCVEDSLKLSEVEKLRDEGRLEEILLPVDTVFSAFPALSVRPEYDRFLKNGNPLKAEMLKEREEEISPSPRYRVYDFEGRFAGLFEKKEKVYRAVKLFL